MNDFTLVTFLLDKSGSMNTGLDDTIGAFNTYLDRLKIGDDEVQFTLLQFDSIDIEKTCLNRPVVEAPALGRHNFVPRGSTPLIDAAYKTIVAVQKQVDESPVKPKIVICIQTDGEENCSREYTWAQLNDLVREKTHAGWQFIFMGASIDAYQQATRMGVARGSTISYNASDAAATESAFAFTAANTRNFSAGVTASASYSAGQKAASGDKFDNWVNESNAKAKPTTVPPAPEPAKPTVSDIDLGGSK